MHAHSWELRAELPDPDDPAHEAFLAGLRADWRGVALDAGDRALCAFAERLSLRPADVGPADLDALRAAGFDDVALHHATQVVAYFNYVNRVADALGVDLEPEMPPP